MTPKEKAIELISKFQEIETDNTIDGGYTFYKIDYEAAIKCAIIAVQEITELATWVDPNLVKDYPMRTNAHITPARRAINKLTAMQNG